MSTRMPVLRHVAVPAGLLLLGMLAAGCTRMESPVSGLGLGKPAPDISGVDADGRPFELRDYRGKVVLLSFWRDD